MTELVAQEIIDQPWTLYLAPVGTEFPLLDDEEADFDAAWTKIGVSGALNYDPSGVKMSHKEKVETFQGSGSTIPVKAFRSAEETMISLKLADMRLEMYSVALNGVGVTAGQTQAPGVSGTKKMRFYRGTRVTTYALLARGSSPYNQELAAQVCLPVCFQSAAPSPSYQLGKPAMLDLEFTALRNPDATGDDDRFGWIEDATTVAGT
jgi:hypothetical protein